MCAVISIRIWLKKIASYRLRHLCDRNAPYLRVVSALGLVIEDVQKRVSVLGGMQIGGMHDRCHVLCIRQCFQSLISDIDRMLNGSFPIRVFINYRRQDFGKVIAVRVPDESAEDLGAPVGLDPVLDVFAVEGEVRFRFHDAQEQIVA